MTYRLNFELPDENLEVFLRNVAPKVGAIRLYYLEDHEPPGPTVNTTHRTESAPVAEGSSAPKPKPPRPIFRRKVGGKLGRKRGSVVNTAILTAIGDGQATIQQMKLALSRAGRSPGSLSTGLAFLQKEGIVERTGTGLYQRTHKEPLPNEPAPLDDEPPPSESPETIEAPTTDPLAAL